MARLDLREYRPQSVLIVKPSSLGDVVHSLYFLTALKRSLPEARVGWVIARGFAPLLEGHPMVERLHYFDRERWRNKVSMLSAGVEFFRFIQEIQDQHYEAVIDLQGLARSAYISMESKAPVRVGFSNAREMAPLFYTHTVHADLQELHAVDRYLKIATECNLDVSDKTPVFPDVAQERSAVLQKIAPLQAGAEHALVTFNPGARWESKRWGAEKFVQLGRKLALIHRVKLLIVGGPEEKGLCESIQRGIGRDALSLAGKTNLRETVALLSMAKLHVGCDSGPLHLAAALGIRCIGIYGPTSPVRVAPYGAESAQVLQLQLDCIQCYEQLCPRVDYNMRCMSDLDAETVFGRIGRYLQK